MCTVSAASELAAMLPVTATPSSCCRKSRWNQARRNSPSVTLRMPRPSTVRTASAIASSSTARSSAAVIVAAARCRPSGEHRRWAQQAADLVGAERRIDRTRHSTSSSSWIASTRRSPPITESVTSAHDPNRLADPE